MYEESIKRAIRISHTKLDDEIRRIEEYACQEMIRAGVPESIVAENNVLIENAVVTMGIREIGNEKDREKAEIAWEYQLDNLRKHDWSRNV